MKRSYSYDIKVEKDYVNIHVIINHGTIPMYSVKLKYIVNLDIDNDEPTVGDSVLIVTRIGGITCLPFNAIDNAVKYIKQSILEIDYNEKLGLGFLPFLLNQYKVAKFKATKISKLYCLDIDNLVYHDLSSNA